ncbi:GMC family oxidoreductase [Streptomyces sp. NBC_01231]|nr:GMC family oxidoreductase [Streptomyces sp. NBC_01231]
MITGVAAPGFDTGPGVAISSAMRPDSETLVQLCRVSPGAHPLAGILLPFPLPGPWRAFGRRTALLFAMERKDSALTSRQRRTLFGRRMTFRPGTLRPEPVQIPAAEAVADTYARRIGGRARHLWTTVLKVPITAHLMGGCPTGTDPASNVADPYHRVHGYPTLHITDASVIPGNLGLNPSLTITAMAERAFAAWPQVGTTDPRPRQDEPYRPLPLAKAPACRTRSSSAWAAGGDGRRAPDPPVAGRLHRP